MAKTAMATSGEITDHYWRDRVRGLNIIGALVKAGQLEAAQTTTEQISDTGLKAAALSEIALAQVKSGDIAGARQAAEQFPDIPLRAMTLTHITAAIAAPAKTLSGK